MASELLKIVQKMFFVICEFLNIKNSSEYFSDLMIFKK